MSASDLVNQSFFVMVNAIFTIAGMFLNVTVIISFWKSSKLRKELCYFMILVLSCFDLAVVAISQPLQVYSMISFYHGKNSELEEQITSKIFLYLNGSSMQAMFMLTIERYLALVYPFFHQTSVTRRRLILGMGILFFLMSVVYWFFAKSEKIEAIATMTYLSIFLLSIFYLNYKMFLIAKSKRMNRIVPSSTHQEEERCKVHSKQFSTCTFVVICYAVCSCPSLALLIIRLSKAHFLDVKQETLFPLWAATFFQMNSTLNCLIFFWRNSILRREAMTMFRRS